MGGITDLNFGDLEEKQALAEIVPEAIGADDNKVSLDELERADGGRFGSVAERAQLLVGLGSRHDGELIGRVEVVALLLRSMHDLVVAYDHEARVA